MDKYPLIYVEWHDHWAEGSWSKADAEDALTLCQSVGWLFKETKETIILASSFCEETGQVGNKQCIGKGMMVKKVVLKKVKNPKT